MIRSKTKVNNVEDFLKLYASSYSMFKMKNCRELEVINSFVSEKKVVSACIYLGMN